MSTALGGTLKKYSCLRIKSILKLTSVGNTGYALCQHFNASLPFIFSSFLWLLDLVIFHIIHLVCIEALTDNNPCRLSIKIFFLLFHPADPRGITSREVYQDFQPNLTSSAGGAKSCLDHRFCAPLDHTAQLLTLHQLRANNQYRTANQTRQHLNSLPFKYYPSSTLLDFSDCMRIGISNCFIFESGLTPAHSEIYDFTTLQHTRIRAISSPLDDHIPLISQQGIYSILPGEFWLIYTEVIDRTENSIRSQKVKASQFTIV